MKRKASAVWNGTGKEGKGHLNTQSGALKDLPYSFHTRFENEDGKAGTNPEELIGAAHAGCYAMALSFALNGAGFTAEELKVDAVVHLEKEEVGFGVPKVDLKLDATIPDISEEKFMELANDAKKNCPISKLFKAEITLDANLK
ncbi:OsmC family protein [Flavilitoribacter nigricans]|uniref:OsmC family peroxiredoxin n=1 Tax=Flavilitoribacter nigricans (strain ATCC 23147 / DSM 23189 / NBRC 102662 / NCIMB 1420 / SS-2) TaxID=1122177 RepID=A0A2D0MWM0_FLAN2|nr:OsmC family protein [Flavilitoribacter nigricans]PHN00671.1 OsmC family peroxiredoxin [Flavilitoribacter nigricans DSM 23189 = NBRC 102662]